MESEELLVYLATVFQALIRVNPELGKIKVIENEIIFTFTNGTVRKVVVK